MRVVVFGATGRTGRLVVERALAEGHEVTAFARDPDKMGAPRDRLRVVQGDVRDAEAVAEAVKGQDAVLSALGPSGPDLDGMTVGARHILAAMERHGVRRLVTLTGAGVPDPNDRPRRLDRAIAFLLRRTSPRVLADAQGHVDRVRASGVEWTIVRVGRLVDGPPAARVRVGWVGVNTGPFVSCADAAHFMVEQLTDHTHMWQAPMISR